MDAFGLNHLVNILYREDELSERTKLVFRWVKEKEDLTQNDFDKLISYCNEKQIKIDMERRYGKSEEISDEELLQTYVWGYTNGLDGRSMTIFTKSCLKTNAFNLGMKDAQTKNMVNSEVMISNAEILERIKNYEG